MGPEYYWMGGMWMFPVIFLVVLVIIGYVIYSKGGSRPPYCGRDQELKMPESALDILKKRYAKGEITKEEFEQMKRDIQ